MAINERLEVKFDDQVIAEVVDYQEDLAVLLAKPKDLEGDALLMRILNKRETVTVSDKQYLVMEIVDSYYYRLKQIE